METSKRSAPRIAWPLAICALVLLGWPFSAARAQSPSEGEKKKEDAGPAKTTKTEEDTGPSKTVKSYDTVNGTQTYSRTGRLVA